MNLVPTLLCIYLESHSGWAGFRFISTEGHPFLFQPLFVFQVVFHIGKDHVTSRDVHTVVGRLIRPNWTLNTCIIDGKRQAFCLFVWINAFPQKGKWVFCHWDLVFQGQFCEQTFLQPWARSNRNNASTRNRTQCLAQHQAVMQTSAERNSVCPPEESWCSHWPW